MPPQGEAHFSSGTETFERDPLLFLYHQCSSDLTSSPSAMNMKIAHFWTTLTGSAEILQLLHTFAFHSHCHLVPWFPPGLVLSGLCLFYTQKFTVALHFTHGKTVYRVPVCLADSYISKLILLSLLPCSLHSCLLTFFKFFFFSRAGVLSLPHCTRWALWNTLPAKYLQVLDRCLLYVFIHMPLYQEVLPGLVLFNIANCPLHFITPGPLYFYSAL